MRLLFWILGRARALPGKWSPGQQRDPLWIWNPYAPRLRWHYRFAEEVQVQTRHARHHLKGALASAPS